MKLTADNVLWFIYQYNCSVGHPTIIRRRAFEKEFTTQWHTIEPIVNQLEQIDHLIVKRHVFIYDLTEKGLAKAIEMAQYEQENVMVTKRFWMEIGRYLVGLYDRLNSVNCLLVLFSTAMPISANATTWYVTKSGNDSNTGKSVSAAFLTIQKAVDVSVAGDGVLVGDGEYDSISCTKTVTIRSVNGYMKTSIVGNGSRCAFLGYTYGGAEYPKIIGFTLKNGNSGQYAGSAVDGGCIENCYITGCTGSYGVLYSCYARNCVIVNNTSGYSRGLCETSKLYNCTIFGNSCDYVAYAETALYNCIYYGNSKNLIYPYSGAVQCYTYNCYSSDPCFKNPADGDFCLASISPCIDAGNNSYSTTDTDLAGMTRIYNGTIDIGAYEWQPENVNVTFVLGEHGTRVGGGELIQAIVKGETAEAPVLSVASGWRFTGWDADFYSVKSNMTIRATYEEFQALRVKSLTCQQRYPWNGTVDIRYEIEGVEDGASYVMSLLATNLEDQTSVRLRTLEWGGTSVTDGCVTVTAPSGGILWHADRDVGENFRSEHMKVYCKLESSVGTSKIIPGYYCAVDLATGSITYLDYRQEANIPISGWGFADKTRRLIMRRVEPGSVIARAPGSTKVVSLSQPFFIGVFELTLAQEKLITGKRRSWYDYGHLPARASYDEIRGENLGANWPSSADVDEDSLLGRLRQHTGKLFDLPTEVQWEYACRAGTTSNFNNGSDDESSMNALGRYEGNLYDGRGGFSGYVTAVGSYEPNAWGLYDMHGNVWEWCVDRWSIHRTDETVDPKGPTTGDARVCRGGCYHWSADTCRSGYLNYTQPSKRFADSGCRLCCIAE